MLRPVRLALCCILLTAAAAPASAAAQPTAQRDARAEAIRKYGEGSKAFEQKRYKDAIDLFLEADALSPSPALAYNTALAYEAMGDAASALRWAREYLRRAPSADDRKQVQTSIEKLEARLREKGIQQVTVLSTPPGATVVVDDRPLGVTPWTGELRPGSHRVALRLAGHQQAERTFELRADRALELTLSLEVEEAPRVVPTAIRPQPDTAPAPAIDNSSANALTISGIVALGAGVAGLGVALGLEVARAGAEDDVRQSEVQLDAVDKLGTMEDLRLGARIAVGVGGGFALAGGAMLLAGLVSHESELEPKVAAACSDTGCAFTMWGQF
jgi:tetratricopeptide (TPR) repeat protein